MGQRFQALTDRHCEFIGKQKLFFVGTATGESRINISPKGMDTFRILANDRVLWLNVTGSGNESAAHVQQDPRMTVMFCAFDGDPMILRLYGSAKVVHRSDPQWAALAERFPSLPGARQLFDMKVELVQTSCGTGVPYFAYQGERGFLNEWAFRKGEEGLRRYWAEKNRFSIDGIPTFVTEKNA
ncbi:MAG: pyridoxamine 5'-phosphate oxidase family protein [Betaproteobacteria bacterium]|nr:pyridoxamine 5'-phosphate oxidase family protein [Betaproteobacteria bacterium]